MTNEIIQTIPNMRAASVIVSGKEERKGEMKGEMNRITRHLILIYVKAEIEIKHKR
jgi:hypothetical protein